MNRSTASRESRPRTLLQEFFNYTSLNILSMIGLSVYILPDTCFISSGVGTTGLTALNLALPIYDLVNGIGLMLGIGGAALFIISRTMLRREASDAAFSTAAAAGIVFGIALAAVGLLFGDRLALLLGADASSFADTAICLKVVLLFAPMFFLNSILSAFVKNDGSPRLAMAGMLGAVLAAGSSPVVGILILSTHFSRHRNTFSLRPGLISLEMLSEILSGGVPALVTELASGVVLLVFNRLILSLAGNIGVAACGVLANLLLLVIAVYNGLAQGVQPLFGQAFARGEERNIRCLLRYALTMALVFSALFYLAALCFPQQLTAVFNNEHQETMQPLAVSGFPLYFLQCFPLGWNTVLVMFFLSIGKTRQAQTLSLLKDFGIVIPLSLPFARLFGMPGVWLTMPVTEALVLALGLFFLARTKVSGIREPGDAKVPDSLVS